jgi:hypothetical protein
MLARVLRCATGGIGASPERPAGASIHPCPSAVCSRTVSSLTRSTHEQSTVSPTRSPLGGGRLDRSLQASRAGATSRRSWVVLQDWTRVTVVESKPAAEGLRHLVIDAGGLMAGYTMPGQYVQVGPPK